MSTETPPDNPSRGETSFITTSGGVLTEQLVSKLRAEHCSEAAIAPETFGVDGQDGPSTPSELEEATSEAWEDLIERWDSISRSNDVFEMDVSEIRSQWLVPLFEALGFDPTYQQSHLSVDGIEANLSHLGWDDPETVTSTDGPRSTPPVLHMIKPDPDHRLDVGDHRGAVGRRKSPHDELQTYLNANGKLTWSVVSDGLTLRILRDYYHTYARGYVEFDLESIFTNRSYGDFRALYRLLHASRFTPQDEELPLESLYQVALATGVKVGEDLQSNVVEALETLGNGFLTPEIREQLAVGGQQAEDDYYQDLLRIVYRLLFLMFAEQRGMMADRGDLYTEEYSINRLRTRSERHTGRDRNTDLWDGLQVTFEMVGHGVDEDTLHVPGYNGGLFDDDQLEYVSDAECPNQALLEAIFNLTHIEQQGYQQRISYADLGVDEIGAVYESLLEFTPKYTETPIEYDERSVSAGTFYLDARGMERKETGSYYTKPELVDELIDSALEPVVENRLANPETTSEKEAALLSIDVVDPACGSGAFLIAANNYLGKRLAKIRSDSEYPDEATIREARRSVVQHCLYGVDLNPMAVELAKVSLWINSAVKDQPLSFLDHRIKHGNSLLGATPELLEEGVPVDAYETSSGREWHMGNEVRKQVRSQNRELDDSDQIQAGLDWQYQSSGEHIDIAEQLESLDEKGIDDVQRKAELYEEFEDAESLETERLAHDVWTAAFYWPLDGSASLYPTPQNIERVRREAPHELETPDTDLERLCQRARELSETHSFFHWPLEFPLVYQDSGGFDCVLANPPWERLDFETEQFFAVSRPDIANASTAAKRDEMIEALEDDDPDLYEAYQTAKEGTEAAMSYMRDSGRYELTGRGHVNTYALFAEWALDNVNATGYNGLLVPTGIATDANTQAYFRKLIEEQRLDSLFDFENSKGIFPAVHRSYKFSLLTQTGKDLPQDEFELAFYLTEIDQLYIDENVFKLTREEIERLNPNTKNCPTFESEADADLVLKIYQGTEAFVIENRSEGDPWNASIHRMYNMSDDSGLFRNYTDLSNSEWDRSGQILTQDDEELIGLYESKLTHQFNHRFGTFDGQTDEEINDGDAREIPEGELDTPSNLATPRYWIPKAEYEDKSGRKWHIALRDIARATDRRTAIYSIIPEAASGHSLNHITGPDADDALLLAAAFNSFTQDFVARQKVGGTHLSHFIIRQLPIPDPEQFEELHYEGSPIGGRIKDLALMLTYHATDLEDFAQEAGYDGEPYSYSTPNGRPREEVRFELEALMAHVYDIEADDFERLFDTFEQIRDEEIDEYGHYRTRDEIKEQFENMKDDITKLTEVAAE